MTAAPATVGESRGAPLRMLLVVTGASSAAFVPYWLNWIAAERPHTRLRILVSDQATRFVTPASLRVPLVDEVLADTWDAADDRPLHVELTEWAEVIVVSPASQNYLASFAMDAADRPSLLVLQLTHAPVIVAPSVAPGGPESGGFRRSWAELESRPGVRLLPPVPGVSRHRADLTAWIAAPMTDVFAELDGIRQDAAARDTSEYGTRLLRTAVDATGEGCSWTRRPGPDAPRPFVDPRHPAAMAVSAARPRGTVVAEPTPDGSGRRYAAPSARTAAALLLDSGPVGRAIDIAHGLGATLAAMHALPVPADATPDPSRGISRLVSWLDLSDQPPLMRSAQRELLSQAPRAARTLREVAREVTMAVPPQGVVCHGAPGLGSAIVDERGGVVLLTGEDVHVGSRESDLMWVLGEVLEFSFTRSDDARAWADVLEAFLTGYGRTPAIPVPQLAALRILLHLHDYIAYVGWSAGEFQRYGGMLRYLTDVEVEA